MKNKEFIIDKCIDMLELLFPSHPKEGQAFSDYITGFYNKENILPKMDFISENMGYIYDKSDEENKTYIYLVVMIRLKQLYCNNKEYEKAMLVNKAGTNNVFNIFLGDKYKIKYLDIPFIINESAARFRVNNKIDDQLFKVLKKMFIEAKDMIEIVPCSYHAYSIEDEDFYVCFGEIDFVDLMIAFCIELLNRGEPELGERCCYYCLKAMLEFYETTINEENITFYYSLAMKQFSALKIAGQILSENVAIAIELYRLAFEVYSLYYSTEGYEISTSDIKGVGNELVNYINGLKSDYAMEFKDEIKQVISFGAYFQSMIHYEEEPIMIGNILEIQGKNQLPKFKYMMIDDVVLDRRFIDDFFKLEQYKKIAEVYDSISEKESLSRQYFKIAYSLSECRRQDEAKKLYECILSEEDNSAVYNNLGVIYENHEKDYKKAMEFYKRALELDLNDKIAAKNIKRVEGIIKDLEEKPKRLKEVYFNKTKSWHKKVLFAIYKLSDKANISIDDLSTATKQSTDSLKKIINELQRFEMILIENNSITLNPFIEPLVRDYIDPKLDRQIIKADSSKLYRPIFYHESEIFLYKVLIELFPQHVVFPNMSLKTIFNLDKMKELLDNETISYLYMAHVDFAIINTSTYFPILAFEKDSDFNDTDYSKELVKRKNTIFATGGIPLIRLRFNSGMDYEKLKSEVREATKSLILEYSNDNSSFAVNLSQEFDAKRFGIVSSPIDLDDVRRYWEQIVGKAIFQKSKIIDIEDEKLTIEISKDLKAIMEISENPIKQRLIDKYSILKDVVFVWY